MTAPLVVARDLSLTTSRGEAFSQLNFELPRGSLGAVVGEAGSGKSALLLAMTGRMRGVTGSLTIDGESRPRRIARLTSVARIDRLVTPEPSLCLEDCITERTLADGASARARHANYLKTARILGLEADRTTLYASLTPAEQTRAAVALAAIRPASLIVLDDLDDGLTVDEQAALWEGLHRLAAEGAVIVAATSEPTTVPETAVTINLENHDA